MSRVYYGALKAFWEVRIYEMRSHFYDVCSILEQDGDVYFSTEIQQDWSIKNAHQECFCFFYSV